jgi:hypothetical protein
MNRRSFFHFIGSCAALACLAPGKLLAAMPQGVAAPPKLDYEGIKASLDGIDPAILAKLDAQAEYVIANATEDPTDAFYYRAQLFRPRYVTKPHTVGTWAESVQVEDGDDV